MLLMQAHNQWATRPADERFVSLTDLHEHNKSNRWNSKQAVVSTRKIEVQPVYSDDKPTGQLVLMGPAVQAGPRRARDSYRKGSLVEKTDKTLDIKI